MPRSLYATVLALFATAFVASCASSGNSTKPSGTQAEASTDQSDNATSPSTEDPAMSERIEAPDDFAVIAHRGARALKPENTLPSFEAALDARPDIVELDLHLSKDGRLVVWHDPFVRASKCRRPEGSSLPKPAPPEAEPEAAMVRNLTVQQLRSYRCAQNPDPEAFPRQNTRPTAIAGEDYGIVPLSEFFEFVQSYASSDEKSEQQRRRARRVEFFLEIKRHPDHPTYIGDGFDGSAPGTMEKELVSIVREYGVVDRSTVQGFIRPSLWAVHSLDSKIGLSVAEAERGEPLSTYADRGASFWSPNASIVERGNVQEAHDAGLRVVPWTVNDPAKIQELMELGIDGIITDDPALFRRPASN